MHFIDRIERGWNKEEGFRPVSGPANGEVMPGNSDYRHRTNGG
jgi:hypothetical protein